MVQEIIDILSVVTTSALVGNEFAIAAFIHPILSRLDDVTHTKAVKPLAQVTGRAMPFWYIAALGLTGATAFYRQVGSLTWTLSVLAAGLLIASIIFTLVGPLPINKRVAGWDLGALPPGWREDRQRWDWLHRLRVGIVLAAALSGATAVALGRA